MLIGFAAQTGRSRAGRSAEARREARWISWSPNDVTAAGAGFDVDTNEVTLVAADAAEPLRSWPRRPSLPRSSTASSARWPRSPRVPA